MGSKLRKLLIAGGASGFIKGNFSRKLEEHGACVAWHMEEMDGGGHPFTGIPLGCEGVVCMSDMISHEVYHKVCDATKAVGLPFAAAPRKWSYTLPILRMQGVLEPIKDTREFPAVAAVRDAATHCIIEGHQDGRTPSLEEVHVALKRAYGPKVAFQRADYEEAYSRACLVSTPPPQEDETAVFECALKLLEGDLRYLDLDGAALTAEVKKTRGGYPDPKCVQKAREEFLRRCSVRESGVGHPYRTKMIHRWLVNLFQEYKKSGLPGDYPVSRYIYGKCKEWLGATIDSSMIQEARTEALGEWAREIIPYRQAQDYLDGILPEETRSIHELMREGVVKSIFVKSTGIWLTSKVAIDEAFQKAAPVPLPKDPKEGTPEVEPEYPAPVQVLKPVQSIFHVKTPVDEETLLSTVGLINEQVATKLDAFMGEIQRVFQIQYKEVLTSVAELHGLVASLKETVEKKDALEGKLDDLTKKVDSLLLAPVPDRYTTLAETMRHFSKTVVTLEVEGDTSIRIPNGSGGKTHR